jgi:putative transposase
VYNAVIQQWRWRYPNRGYPPQTYASLCREITELRAAVPHLEAVPVHVLQQAAKDALAAIQRFFKGRSGYPRYLSKRRDTDRMRFPDPKPFDVDPAPRRVKLPKLGWVNARFPRALHPDDRITSLTLKRDRLHETWHMQAAIEGPRPTPKKAPVVELVAADLGIVQSATTSEGEVFTVRDETPRERAHRARLQRQIARSRRGSRRQRQRRRRVAQLSADVAARRRQDQHTLTAALVSQAAVVVLEDLRVQAMSASAAGTVDAPGKNVRQKAGLNRALLGQGFGEIRRQVEYKCAWFGRRFLVVPAAYSSQTCAACGHVDAKNRETQAVFRCRHCGHEAHADLNAALVLRQRGAAVITATDTEHLSVAAPGATGPRYQGAPSVPASRAASNANPRRGRPTPGPTERAASRRRA